MPEPSIYHRLESPTQTSQDARRQEKSREIWGRPARYSGIPKVKAYTGILPANRRGIEFTTDVEPDLGMPPHLALWSGPRPGVRIAGEYAILEVLTVVNRQK